MLSSQVARIAAASHSAVRRRRRDRTSLASVIVDNGVRGAEAAVVQPPAPGVSVRRLRPERPGGPGAGRNLGWRAAHAPLIAFTDDDCEPTPGWLDAILRSAAAHPGAIVQGPTRPIPRERHRDGLLTHTVRIDRLGPHYETCNIVYPRAVLAALDGFDESFGREPAGEDTDLAWRALAAGRAAVFAPDAVVHHAVVALGLTGALRRAARWSAVVGVFARHPGARAMLYRGRFWNVWHYLTWRSLLVVPVPRRLRRLRRLILARHLLALTARAREAGVAGPQLLGAVPFLLVHDAVECAAVARGAIRERTLVL